jgi:hypothetical protein
MIVPVVLILVQLGIRYAARPLEVNESALVNVRLVDDASIGTIPIAVDPGDGLQLETPVLRIPAEQEISFRVGAVKEGEYQLAINIGDERINQTIVVSDRVLRVYDKKSKPSFMGVLLYPGQPPLPRNSKVEEISVKFPPQEVSVLGWNVNWLVFFFIISIIAGYSLKGVFKVEV